MPPARRVENTAIAYQYEEIIVTPPVEATPDYSTGDALGGVITLPNAVRMSWGFSVLDKVVVIDQSNSKIAMDIFFFSDLPTASTENGALDVSDADMLNCQGTLNIPTTAYITAGDNAVATLEGIDLPMKVKEFSVEKTTLYALIQARGTINFAAATDLQIAFTFKNAY